MTQNELTLYHVDDIEVKPISDGVSNSRKIVFKTRDGEDMKVTALSVNKEDLRVDA